MTQRPLPTPSHSALSQTLAPLGLMIYGTVHPALVPCPGLKDGTLILIGTDAPFWQIFQTSPEAQDSAPDPIDRWSKRQIDALAQTHGATAYYPFGGPPYQPFVAWALASGRAFTSPSHMLVHDAVGMMISYRGALHFDRVIDSPAPPLAQSPCLSCQDRPCLTTCPVHALVDEGPYNLSACHAYLDAPQGAACLTSGCLARRACPLSAGAGRAEAQTAHHMSYFHR